MKYPFAVAFRGGLHFHPAQRRATVTSKSVENLKAAGGSVNLVWCICTTAPRFGGRIPLDAKDRPDAYDREDAGVNRSAHFSLELERGGWLPALLR